MSTDWKPSITLEDGESVVMLIGAARRMLKQFKPEAVDRFYDEVKVTQSYDDAKRCIEKHLDVRWEEA